MNKKQDRLQSVAKQAALQEANRMKAEARAATPIDTGALKRSIHIDPGTMPNEAMKKIIANATEAMEPLANAAQQGIEAARKLGQAMQLSPAEVERIALQMSNIANQYGIETVTPGETVTSETVSPCPHGMSSSKWCDDCERTIYLRNNSRISTQRNVQCPSAPLPDARCDNYERCAICRRGAPQWDELVSMTYTDVDVARSRSMWHLVAETLEGKVERFEIVGSRRLEERAAMQFDVVIIHKRNAAPGAWVNAMSNRQGGVGMGTPRGQSIQKLWVDDANI